MAEPTSDRGKIESTLSLPARGAETSLLRGITIDSSNVKDQSQPKNLGVGTGNSQNNGDGDTNDNFQPDSLSLVQLRRLVADVPKQKQAEYSFVYSDSDTLKAELEEWFTYDDDEYAFLLSCKAQFEKSYQKVPWIKSSLARRRRFLFQLNECLESASIQTRTESLLSLCYVLQGVFGETRSEAHQIYWIRENCRLFRRCCSLDAIWDCVRACMLRQFDIHSSTQEEGSAVWDQKELRASLTVLYILVEICRRDDTSLQYDLVNLQHSPLTFLVRIIARLRWEDATNIPVANLLLLYWKMLLATFGTSTDLTAVKNAKAEISGVSGPSVSQKASTGTFDKITASPLDYYTFRQELLSKYPAYNPPVVPKFQSHSLLSSINANSFTAPQHQTSASTNPSILHQPVHIATPAPSPPPSPVGAKGAKKQNYQTNQNFPFLYPPTALGGWKDGWADINSAEVGVPESIREGGELFRRRVRVSPALLQLAEERERFMKAERGWLVEPNASKPHASEQKTSSFEEAIDENSKLRLQALEEFYRGGLPEFQSFVIVLLKIVLGNLSAMPPTQQQAQQYIPSNPQPNPNGEKSKDDDATNGGGGVYGESGGVDNISSMPLSDVDKLRMREITNKAISAILLAMLKWLRVSHVLQFEYLAQLLLDSNYLPLALKLFSLQEVSTAVATITDRKEHSYFNVCSMHSQCPPSRSPHEVNTGILSVDAPQQLTVQARNETSSIQASKTPLESSDPPVITHFSWRNFFSAINFLRIMQKICKGKAHRNLLLVQYKSSAILRKPLKVPQEDLRLYALKLFKGQVPYCGRKWRQSNMRVITSIYLYCRPELRDDWLAGSDVDAEVEEALPHEHALRALTHFYNLNNHPNAMASLGYSSEAMTEDQDFFSRQLERLHWLGLGDQSANGEGDEDEFGWDGPPLIPNWN